MILTLLSVAIILMPNPCKNGIALIYGCTRITGAIKNVFLWISIFGIHPLLILLYSVHFVVRIQINMLIQLHIFRICIFWPYFYWSLFRRKENRCYVWDIMKNPVPHKMTKDQKIVWLHCLFVGQVLIPFLLPSTRSVCASESKIIKYLDEAVEASTRIFYYDYPIRLYIPYQFLVNFFLKSPDGMIKKILSIGIMLFVYMYIMICGLICLWMRLFAAYFIKIYKIYVFVRHGHRRFKRFKFIPTLHVNVLLQNLTIQMTILFHEIRME